jgi:protein phosphatase
MLYCPNPTCQTANPESNQFCQKCCVPLIRQYLWSVGAVSCSIGELLGDRFLYKGSRVFLDTKPGLLAANSAEVPAAFVPYLRLSPLRLHVPQVYDWLSVNISGSDYLMLLEHAPLWVTVDPVAKKEIRVQLFPTLLQEWQKSSPSRQLNWLWQMANLWQPLSSEQVVSSLLEPDLLRVEGSILHLLELRSDSGNSDLSLANLGNFWLQWVASARSEIVDRFQQICQQLVNGQIHNAEILTERLDEAITEIAQAQRLQVQISTLTDQGPSRPRNEDACYPQSGTVERSIVESRTTKSGTVEGNPFPLVIVCDGIGGHQGGDVASHLAIETVEQHVKSLDLKALDPVTLTVELENATCAANDQISQRNDSEQRYERQRMGTTLVMGLMRGHELYVTHVGDSRAYWITRSGCRQITLDDDVASREVRLGYSAYRQALQQPSAGSLVQALGMGASNLLYPTVQRFLLDEDSVFVFCSDGLSDNDRVETIWDSEILPLLEGKTEAATVTARLVEIANTLNGYDNATVGLLYCQTTLTGSTPVLVAASSTALAASATQQTVLATPPRTPHHSPSRSTGLPESPTFSDPSTSAPLKTKLVRSPQSLPPVSLLLGIVALLGLGGGLLAYWLLPFGKSNSVTVASSPSSGGLQPASPQPSALTSLKVSDRVIVRSPLPAAPPTLFSSPLQAEPLAPIALPSPDSLGTIPQGGVLEILSASGATDKSRWVQVRVCSAGVISELPPQSSTQPAQPSTQPTQPIAQLTPSLAPASPAPATSPSATKETPKALPNSPFSPASPAPAVAGTVGWIEEANLLPFVAALPLSTADACPTPSPN